MKRISTLIVLLAIFCFSAKVMAQGSAIWYLDAALNGQSGNVPVDGMSLSSEMDAAGHYTRNIDYTYVLSYPDCNAPNAYGLEFESFDVGSMDTLFLYDGPDVNSPLLVKCNNSYYKPTSHATYFASQSNVAKTITIRFKTSSYGGGYPGWRLTPVCSKPCGSITPVIDSVFYRVRNGRIYDTSYVKMIPIIDTLTLDTTGWFPGMNLCLGDGVIFNGHGLYSNSTGYYTARDATSLFRWDFGNTDSLVQMNAVRVPYNGYTEVGCFDVVLSIIDTNDCKSSTNATVRVRMAQNPLKTIYDLNTICTTDSLLVSVGYDGDNATLTLRKIDYAQSITKVNDVKTFIPDGPQAADRQCGPRCYTADVEFTEFPVGRTIQSADDICSICVNYEHSYMGDYSLAIICPATAAAPNGQKAYLKYKNAPTGYPGAAGGGGSRHTGIPYGGNDGGTGGNAGHSHWDNTTGAAVCDTAYNMFGVGWNYCFSRNEEYTLAGSGLQANTTQTALHYMTNAPVVPVQHVFDPLPAWFDQTPGNAIGTFTLDVLDSSDHAGKSNYYMPADDFSSLIGCPLNGFWKIEICDELAIDNGWVFNWSMDICGVSTDRDCQYQVGIDSVHWGPDTIGGRNYDIYNGKYRGLEAHKVTDVDSYFLSPDTSGTFPVSITLFDEFGCQWDTVTRITITRTPTPYLGRDTVICGDQFVVLDGKDYYSTNPRANYSYIWEPYGNIGDTVHTIARIGDTTNYVVEVTNYQNLIYCSARDTIAVSVSIQPIPNFDPGRYPLEGCEPFTVDLNNASLNASKFLWVFGDGATSTEPNPRHTYSTGTYDFKLYTYSDAGCVDSLVYPELVTVYSSPDARFTWEPAYPTVSQPRVTLINRTTPNNPDYEYFWEIQYDKDYPYSFHTLPTKDSVFEWYTNGRDISGDYVARMIARSKNIGPSGNLVYCSDTVENTILVINDFLQFPNVVTPNGDGVNDRFVILNLVGGQAYPTNCLDIYDKWGSRVFHKENISSDEDFWDPAKTRSPDGTYFFRFSAKGYNGSIERNGAIEVLR